MRNLYKINNSKDTLSLTQVDINTSLLYKKKESSHQHKVVYRGATRTKRIIATPS